MSSRMGWYYAMALSCCLACGRPEDNARTRAKEVWHSHETVLVAAAKGESVDIEKFEKACMFFERVAGIPIPGDGNYIGWVPTKDTIKSLEPLRRWYEVHGDELYWDGRKVILLPPQKDG